MTRFEKLTLALGFLALLPASISFYGSAISRVFSEPELTISPTSSELTGLTACCFRFSIGYEITNLSDETASFKYLRAFAQEVEFQWASIDNGENLLRVFPGTVLKFVVDGEVAISKDYLDTFLAAIEDEVGASRMPAELSRDALIANGEEAGRIYARLRGTDMSEYGYRFGQIGAMVSDSSDNNDQSACDEEIPITYEPHICVFVRAETLEGLKISTPWRKADLALGISPYVDGFHLNTRGWSLK